jgi:hypothetical protein
MFQRGIAGEKVRVMSPGRCVDQSVGEEKAVIKTVICCGQDNLLIDRYHEGMAKRGNILQGGVFSAKGLRYLVDFKECNSRSQALFRGDLIDYPVVLGMLGASTKSFDPPVTIDLDHGSSRLLAMSVLLA